MHFTIAIIGLITLAAQACCQELNNSTFANPILPGWHSDPSCVFVAEHNNTFFCTSSTFLAFPGLPIYASQDLLNWKLVSSSLNRPSQLPELANYTEQSYGIFAPTLRYENGTFYNVVVALSPLVGLIFKTTDPYSNDAWEEPVRFTPAGIDPDLFWDDDGQVYVTQSGIVQSKIDLITGETGDSYSIWNGTGGSSPEGPRVFKKHGFYYLSKTLPHSYKLGHVSSCPHGHLLTEGLETIVVIAEGGTELGHSETIARSINITGPYESFAGNPILTNRNTTEYFQTVGHADLFQDATGN